MSKQQPIILVTGAKGQLGQSLQAQAEQLTAFTWVFYDKSELDICQPKSVAAAFKKHQPAYCINTAAFTDVNQAEENPAKAMAVNVEGVRHLIAACNQYRSCLVQLSTDYVFDGEQAFPYLESHLPNPLNRYGKTKAKAEQLVLTEAQKHYIVRTSWLYNKKQGHNFYRSIQKKALAGEGLSVVNDQVGTPTSTEELVVFLVRLLEKKPAHGIYHYAGKEILSWYAFAKKILKEQQLEVSLKAVQTPQDGIQRPRFSALATEKVF